MYITSSLTATQPAKIPWQLHKNDLGSWVLDKGVLMNTVLGAIIEDQHGTLRENSL